MRSRILTRRTAGLLGIAGLSVTATVGFATAGLADQTPTASTGSTAATPSAKVTVTGDSSMKSGATKPYTVKLTVSDGPLKNAKLTAGGSWHGGTVKWTGGCTAVAGAVCSVGDVSGTKTTTLTYTAPKVSKDTSGTLTVTPSGDGTNDNELVSGSHPFTVNKPASSSPTPTKTAKPSPTKSTSKPSPSKSRQSHTASHKPSHTTPHKTKSHAPAAPHGQGGVPVPTSVPTDVPSIPAGTQAPWAPTTPTDEPTLPSVAPSPEASPRSPNVAEPPNKASGQVRTDAVSVPAAAAAAFVGIGAGTLITRSVRRRGLWRSVGRHRE